MNSKQILDDMRQSIQELESQIQFLEIDGVGHLPRDDSIGGEGEYTHIIAVTKTTSETSRPSAEQHTRKMAAAFRDDAAFNGYEVAGTRTVKEPDEEQDLDGQ